MTKNFYLLLYYSCLLYLFQCPLLSSALLRTSFLRESFAKVEVYFQTAKFFQTFFSKIIFHFVKSISIFLIDRCHIVCFSKASAKVDTFNESTKYFLVFFQTIFLHIPPTSYNTTNYDIKKICYTTHFLKIIYLIPLWDANFNSCIP